MEERLRIDFVKLADFIQRQFEEKAGNLLSRAYCITVNPYKNNVISVGIQSIFDSGIIKAFSNQLIKQSIDELNGYIIASWTVLIDEEFQKTTNDCGMTRIDFRVCLTD